MMLFYFDVNWIRKSPLILINYHSINCLVVEFLCLRLNCKEPKKTPKRSRPFGRSRYITVNFNKLQHSHVLSTNKQLNTIRITNTSTICFSKYITSRVWGIVVFCRNFEHFEIQWVYYIFRLRISLLLLAD